MLLQCRILKFVGVGHTILRASLYTGVKLDVLTKKELGIPYKKDWNAIVKDAEKIVGDSASIINLFNDNANNVANDIVNNLVEANNIKAKSEKKRAQFWRLVILMFSKAAANNLNNRNSIELNNQTATLAEITRMLKKGFLVHNNLINIADRENTPEGAIRTNKVNLLVGDCFLATAFNLLSSLKNKDILILLMATFRDLSEAEFVGDRDPQNLPLPTKPKRKEIMNSEAIDIWTDPLCGPLNTGEAMGYAADEWIVRNVLGGASLLGRACEAVMVLRGYSNEIQKQGYYFGCYLALAFCASEELVTFRSTGSSFSLVCAPVLFALENDPSLYDYISTKATYDYEYLRCAIADSKSLEKTEALCADFTGRSLEIMSKILLETDTSITLEKIILSATAM